MTKLARYGNVPLCNLERDDPRYLIDIAYARRLQRESVVLWWSAGPRPDHAGYEKDDILGPMETVDMPAVNTPGTYSTVCVDIEVKNLLINTILTSSLINDLEGSDSVSFNPAADETAVDGTLVLHAENTFASAGIKILREMVRAWHSESCNGGEMADVMVGHLVRWVESPDSFLYDRSLHYYVQVMAKKAFQQLMADCRRVGSHVVFANQNRLLLQTTKAEVGNAYAYSQYILKTITAKPLFSFLDLDVKEYWDYLIWYDEFNYGGQGCAEVTAAEEQKLDCIMHWQMQDFLPVTLQPVFHEQVIDFITLMHKRKRPRDVGGIPRATQLPFQNLTQENAGDETTVLKEVYAPGLKKQVQQLVRRQKAEMLHPELESDYKFPSLPGSHLHPQNPVLELVKTIMQVLSLDKSINLEVRLLRKDLLALFEVREFSSEGQFINPSTSLKVAQLVCTECSMVRDLDLCRDDDGIVAGEGNEQQPQWSCSGCEHAYSRLEIQERLVADVQRAVMRWCSQDLKCAKCARLRVNDFMEHCSCAGEWVGTIKREDIMKTLRVYKRLAQFYDFTMVVDAISGSGV